MTAAVTVILPAYNAADTLAHAVKSVIAQTREDWALCIIDDGSQDQTVEVANSLAAKDPRIKVITQKNQGVAAARNAGVAAANTDFLAFLDADDAYAPTYLERMIGTLEAKPDLAILSCDAWNFHEANSPLSRCSENVPMTPPVTFEKVLSRKFQIYAAAAIRKSWFDQVGGADTSFRNVVDFDLWIRIMLAGGQADYVDEPLAWYRSDQPGSLSGTASRRSLRDNEIRVLKYVLAQRPALQDICHQRINHLEYRNAVIAAKDALLEQDSQRFFKLAQTAQTHQRNWRLMLTVLAARVSPALARKLLTLSN